MKNAAGRTGMGAVMGSKRLKAVAVRGTMDITIPYPDRYLKYYHKTLKQLMETKWAQALGQHGTPLLFHLCNTMGFLSVRNNQATTVGKRGAALEGEALNVIPKAWFPVLPARSTAVNAMQLQRENTKEHRVKALNTVQ